MDPCCCSNGEEEGDKESGLPSGNGESVGRGRVGGRVRGI